MRAKKLFYVIAYDISDNKRRRRVVKVVEQYGGRINLSVFECMMTECQLAEMKSQFEKIIKPNEDQIVFYPICVNCYTKIGYLPDRQLKTSKVASIV